MITSSQFLGPSRRQRDDLKNLVELVEAANILNEYGMSENEAVRFVWMIYENAAEDLATSMTISNSAPMTTVQ